VSPSTLIQSTSRVKRPVHETNRSPASSTDLKMRGA